MIAEMSLPSLTGQNRSLLLKRKNSAIQCRLAKPGWALKSAAIPALPLNGSVAPGRWI